MHLLVAGSLFLGKYLAETYGTCLCAGDYNILLNPKLDTTNQVRRKSPLEKQILQELGLFYYGEVYTNMIGNLVFTLQDIIFSTDLITLKLIAMKFNLDRSPKK